MESISKSSPGDMAAIPFPSVEANACPYPFYERLLREAPVHRIPSGEYLVSRRADIAFVCRNDEIFSSRHMVVEDGWMRNATLEDLEQGFTGGIATSDGQEHVARRKIAFEMFKPGRLREREPMVQQMIDMLIDRFADRGEVEFVSEFADRLPAHVIVRILGLPDDAVDRAIVWGRYEGNGSRFTSREQQMAAREGMLDMSAFMREALEDRHANPRDDDLSRFVRAHAERDGELNLGRLLPDAVNLLAGGIITTSHMLANTMMLLLDDADLMAAVRADHSLIPKVIEESLRFESPVQFQPRLVLEDTEIGGVPVPAGATLLLLFGAANRDEDSWEEPTCVRPERANLKEHMAFGHGPHFCLGAPLARMEGRLAFATLLDRFREIRYAGSRDQLVNLGSLIFRGPARLPLALQPS